MAKMRNSSPKQSGGGYLRLLGDAYMADVFTRAQSTVITNGTELEKILSNMANTIDDLNKFIQDCDAGTVEDGSYLCTKAVVKKSDYRLKGHEPDFITFTVDKKKNICNVIELKDGDAFDTKKSLAEKEMLELFVNHLAPKIPFRTKFYICCFNQLDKKKIVTGFKSVFDIDHVMTGEEFCDVLGISYEDIITFRQNDAADNYEYVADRMGKIKLIQEKVVNNHRNHISKDEFYDD